MPKATKKAPPGWLEVPPYVTESVRIAIRAIAPDLTLADDDAWGAGIPPRVVEFVKTLGTRGARVGPTTHEALKRILMTANEATFELLGGEITILWVFAPSEFARTDQIEPQGPEFDAAFAELKAAAEAAAAEWADQHADLLAGEDES